MRRQRGLAVWCIVSCAIVMACGAPARAQFTPGNIVVSQYGNGVSTGTVPIVLREFTTSGVPTGFTVPLPTVNSGPNYAIVSTSLGNTTIGFLKQSIDKRFLTIFGNGTSATANRTIARIDVLGNVNTTTNFNAAGVSARSAITTDGTNIWWSGDTGSGSTGGIRYLTLGSTTSGVALAQGTTASPSTLSGPNPVPLNSRVIGIFGDQLYGSSAVPVGGGASQYSFRGVFNVGSGLPTTFNQQGLIVVGGGAGGSGLLDSAWEFFFADSSTIYVADDDDTSPFSNGLQKWIFASGSWSKVWSSVPAGATGLRGLTGVVTGSSVQLYGITAASSGTLPTSVVSLADTLTDNVFPSSGFTTLVTSSAGYVFRGVAFAPVPEPAAQALGVAGLAVVAFSAAKRIRRRRDG
jgi:hypothetical protein